MVESAIEPSPGRTQTYPSAQFHRLADGRGAKRAAGAVAHTSRVVAYRLLASTGTGYWDLSLVYFDRSHRGVSCAGWCAASWPRLTGRHRHPPALQLLFNRHTNHKG